MSPADAKRALKAKGWTYRSAAPELGVCYQHLALVLTHRRESRRLCQRIAALPARVQQAQQAAPTAHR
jgi:lambda repressor-like predicted transcriptional regulator